MNNNYAMQFKKYNKYIGSKEYIILQPTYSFSDLFVCEIEHNLQIIFGNEDDLKELGKVFAFQSTNKNYIIHIPSKKDTTDYLKERWGLTRGHDLILLNHTIQFNYKVWKDLRTRLKDGRIVNYTFTIDDKLSKRNSQFSHRDNKDVIKYHSNYDTLFLISSELVFYNIIQDCNNIANGGRELYITYKGFHDHAHLEWYMSFKDRYLRRYNLTIDFYDQQLWTT